MMVLGRAPDDGGEAAVANGQLHHLGPLQGGARIASGYRPAGPTAVRKGSQSVEWQAHSSNGSWTTAAFDAGRQGCRNSALPAVQQG